MKRPTIDQWREVKGLITTNLSSNPPPATASPQYPVSSEVPPSEIRILVAGCGTSKMSEYLYEAGFTNIASVDSSGAVITHMMRENIWDRPLMQWRTMKLTDIEFPNETFDAIIDNGGGLNSVMDDPVLSVTFGHLYLSEVKRLLKPTGRYICITLAEPKVLGVLFPRFRYGWKVNAYSEDNNVFMVVSWKLADSDIKKISVFQQPGETHKSQALAFIEAVETENKLRKILWYDIAPFVPVEDIRTNIKQLEPGRRVQLTLGEHGVSQCFYDGILLDAQPYCGPFSVPLLVLIVPNICHLEWITTSTEEQWRYVKHFKTARLLIVLGRKNDVSNEQIKKDISTLVKKVIYGNCDERKIRFEVATDGIKKKETVHQFTTELSDLTVEDDLKHPKHRGFSSLPTDITTRILLSLKGRDRQMGALLAREFGHVYYNQHPNLMECIDHAKWLYPRMLCAEELQDTCRRLRPWDKDNGRPQLDLEQERKIYNDFTRTAWKFVQLWGNKNMLCWTKERLLNLIGIRTGNVVIADDGVKNQEMLHQVVSALSGLIVVDDVIYEEPEHHRFPEKYIVRRLNIEMFRMVEALYTIEGPIGVSIEVEKDKASTSKMEKVNEGFPHSSPSEPHGEASSSATIKIDHGYLASPHHIGIISGLMLIYVYLGGSTSVEIERKTLVIGVAPVSEVKTVIIGLRGGLLSMFMNNFLPYLNIEVVEKDPLMLDISREYFGFREDEFLKVHIGDGVEFVREKANSGADGSDSSKIDILIVDWELPQSRSNQGLTSPPAYFVDESFLLDVKKSLSGHGLFIINVIGWSSSAKGSIISRLKTVFSNVFSVQLVQDLNDLIFALNSESPVNDSELSEARDKLAVAFYEEEDWGKRVIQASNFIRLLK